MPVDAVPPGDGRSPRVLVVDAHGPTRAGIRATLVAGDCEVVGEAADAPSAIAAAVVHEPDVALVDLAEPDARLALVRAFAERVPSCSVVILRSPASHAEVIDALRSGAAGWLLKDTPPDALCAALRGTLAGETALPRALVSVVVSELQRRGSNHRLVTANGRPVDLTEREWEIASLLCDGLSTPAMADRLGVSPVTVRRHVSNTLRKLAVGDRAAAVALLTDR